MVADKEERLGGLDRQKVFQPHAPLKYPAKRTPAGGERHISSLSRELVRCTVPLLTINHLDDQQYLIAIPRCIASYHKLDWARGSYFLSPATNQVRLVGSPALSKDCIARAWL